MILESISRTYEVVNLTERNPRFCAYRCRNGGKDYILYLIIDEELKSFVCRRFQSISETEFDGLAEMFTYKDDIVIAFFYHELSETADFYSDEDTNEAGKVRFFGDMLASLCIHGVPEDIAADLIEHDNVGVTSDGNPECRYELHSLFSGSIRNNGFSEAFAGKLRKAFESVGRSKRTAAIENLCADIENSPPADVMELFSRYEQCVEPFASMGLGETRRQKMKRIGLKAAKAVKFVIAAAVLGLAVFTLVLALFSEKPDSGGIYEQIGNVKIEEYRK